jgi:hypothetical protein
MGRAVRHLAYGPGMKTRRQASLFILAFGFIAVLSIGEGIDQGFSAWDWLVIAICAAAIVRALIYLNNEP